MTKVLPYAQTPPPSMNLTQSSATPPQASTSITTQPASRLGAAAYSLLMSPPIDDGKSPRKSSDTNETTQEPPISFEEAKEMLSEETEMIQQAKPNQTPQKSQQSQPPIHPFPRLVFHAPDYSGDSPSSGFAPKADQGLSVLLASGASSPPPPVCLPQNAPKKSASSMQVMTKEQVALAMGSKLFCQPEGEEFLRKFFSTVLKREYQGVDISCHVIAQLLFDSQ